MPDDYGYLWIETTTPAELTEGRRTYTRGPKIDPAVEPWTIDTPGGKLVGWVDQHQQNRWLNPETLPSEQGWRRLYVEKAS